MWTLLLDYSCLWGLWLGCLSRPPRFLHVAVFSVLMNFAEEEKLMMKKPVEKLFSVVLFFCCECPVCPVLSPPHILNGSGILLCVEKNTSHSRERTRGVENMSARSRRGRGMWTLYDFFFLFEECGEKFCVWQQRGPPCRWESLFVEKLANEIIHLRWWRMMSHHRGSPLLPSDQQKVLCVLFYINIFAAAAVLFFERANFSWLFIFIASMESLLVRAFESEFYERAVCLSKKFSRYCCCCVLFGLRQWKIRKSFHPAHNALWALNSKETQIDNESCNVVIFLSNNCAVSSGNPEWFYGESERDWQLD